MSCREDSVLKYSANKNLRHLQVACYNWSYQREVQFELFSTERDMNEAIRSLHHGHISSENLNIGSKHSISVEELLFVDLKRVSLSA